VKELDSAKLLSASLKLSESRTTELVDKLRRELTAKFDNMQSVKGVDGPQGPTGRQGDRGERGFIGGTGARGERGEKGDQGIQGATGEQGIQGVTGEQGIQGATGEQGIQGATGEQGIQGATGERGEKGDQGIQGAEGPMGPRGERGLKGDAGINGKNGIDGKDGINGKNGIDGKDGINGKNGIDGKDGINGKNGIDGKVGPRGPRGDKGDPGSDANVAPLEKKFDQLTKTVDTKLSKIAYSAAMGTSAGSGEVNLRNLDDVDYNSVSSPTDGHSLVYNETLGKWQANSGGGGGGGISTSTFNSALANTNLSITNVKSNLTSTNTALRTLIADRLQVANAATIYQTKSIERAALANTNASISNVKTGLTSTNTALRTLISDNTFGYKNRIINGDMRIDQRNAGATKQITATNDYTTDRWRAIATGAGRMDFARSTSTPPTGFSHFLRMTVGVADNSLTSTDEYFISQRIEGFNIADLLFGSASAKAVTLSFWVRSSLTGAFSGALRNAAGGALNRSYPFSYTISAASTWEQKTVTLTADTSGTWTTDASIGVEVCFCVGAATGQLGTANAWTGPTAVSGVTGTTNVMATVSNTFDLTGVQLEKGTVATGFDVRSHQQELALCQRYFCKTFPVGTAPVTGASSIGCLSQNGRELLLSFTKDWRFPVTMRASPTVTTYSLDAGQTYWKGYMLGSTATSNVTNSGDLACLLTGTNQNGLDLFIIHATAAAEL